jgi:hypothetical protein
MDVDLEDVGEEESEFIAEKKIIKRKKKGSNELSE